MEQADTKYKNLMLLLVIVKEYYCCSAIIFVVITGKSFVTRFKNFVPFFLSCFSVYKTMVVVAAVNKQFFFLDFI